MNKIVSKSANKKLTHDSREKIIMPQTFDIGVFMITTLEEVLNRIVELKDENASLRAV